MPCGRSSYLKERGGGGRGGGSSYLEGRVEVGVDNYFRWGIGMGGRVGYSPASTHHACYCLLLLHWSLLLPRSSLPETTLDSLDLEPGCHPATATLPTVKA